MPPQQCTEETAVEVRSIVVSSELGCTQGWQELIAREPESQREAGTVYLKSICRRERPSKTNPG